MARTEELIEAIEADDDERVRALLADDPALANSRDPEGVSVLMRARYRFHPATVDAIMAAGPELDVFDAAAAGDRDRLVGHLDRDPSLVAAFSGDGFSVLHLPAFFGRTDAARLLLDRGAPVDAPGRGWMTGTPLHSAAAGRHTDIGRLLLEAGADPDARQSGGWTPLHSAARTGNAELVELMLAAGADVAARNDEGRSVLELAEEGGDAATIELVRSAVGPADQAGEAEA